MFLQPRTDSDNPPINRRFIASDSDGSSTDSSSSDTEAIEPPAIDETQQDEKELAAKSLQKKKKKKKNVPMKNRDQKKKYKDLLKLAQQIEKASAPNEEMEMTFDDGLKMEAEELVKKHKEKEQKNKESWWETLERERKEKKKESKKDRKKSLKGSRKRIDNDGSTDDEEGDKKKEQLVKLMNDYASSSSGSNVKGFNAKKDVDREKSRRHAKQETAISKEGQFEINLQDERITGLLNDPEFSLDPTHPKFKKTKNVEKILDVKRKRKDESQLIPPTANQEHEFGDETLSRLYQSAKRKAEPEKQEEAGAKRRKNEKQ